MPPIWFHSPIDQNVATRIDRYDDSRSHRLMAGIHVCKDFSHIDGSLLVASGHGKHLRAVASESTRSEIAPQTAAALREFTQQASPSIADLRAHQTDLSVLISQTLVQLKESAGKYVDRVLAASIVEPGFWQKDFDDRPIFYSLCAPQKIAELTGLNVIDGFPIADLESNGSGKKLEALPIWILLSDRNRRAATESRLAVLIGARTEIFLLPASDGLDAELPNIQRHEVAGTEFLRKLESHFGESPGELDTESRLKRVAIEGKAISKLLERWEVRPPQIDSILADVESDSTSVSIQDIFRTLVVYLANQVEQRALEYRDDLPITQLCVAGDRLLATLVVNELCNRKSVRKGKLSVDFVGKRQSLNANIASALGFLLVDQLPASLPWLTGCDAPRILGRITKGRPAAWRRLLVEMADYRPPAMRLRDAI